MGLDMYAFSVAKDSTPQGKPETKELAYWRKHPNLHGWMENLWRARTGNQTDAFNCTDVELTLEDLEALENAILLKDLPSTQGFFFGSEADEYYKKQDLQFIKEAKADLFCGLKVFYSSWW